MNFDIYGPFSLKLPARDYERWRASFWTSQRYGQDTIDGLKAAIGCYAFCLTRGKVSKPWYVGKTEASFSGEIFQNHKINHYRDIQSRHQGKASIILFPLVKSQEDWNFSYARKSAATSIRWLERTLIGMALARNPDIVNDRDTKMLRNVWVNGLIRKDFRESHILKQITPAEYS